MTVADELLAYLFRLRVPTASGGSARFDDVADDWQRKDMEALGRSIVWSMRAPGSTYVPTRHFVERSRGSSKTGDVSLAACWTLAAAAVANRPMTAVVAAGDRDQASLLVAAMKRVVELNRLDRGESKLIVQSDRVVSKSSGSSLIVLSSDVSTSWGTLADLIILDELSTWKAGGQGLWESMFSAAAKKPNCVLVAISNAGWRLSWQWPIREAVKVDPAWRFSRLDRKPSWIPESSIEEQRRLLPESVFRRLWRNEWVEGSGDGLNADDVRGCIRPDLSPMESPSPGYSIFAGLDLSTKRDHSALAAIAMPQPWLEELPADEKPKLTGVWAAMADLGFLETSEPESKSVWHEAEGNPRLAWVQSWKPGPGGVDLEAVERDVLLAHNRLRFSAVLFDPFQAHLLAARLRRQGVPMVEVPFQGQALNEMASEAMQRFRDRTIDLYPDEELIADLMKLRIVERSFGLKLEAAHDSTGHADRAIALALALVGAKRYSGAMAATVPGELCCWP